MKAIYLDCFAGISGNMLLAALISAGAPEEYIREGLSKLITGDEFSLTISDVNKNGIKASYAEVLVHGQPPEFHISEEGDFKSAHTHDDESHGFVHLHKGEPHVVLPRRHDENGKHDHSHEHVHRTMTDIRKMITAADIPARAKELSLKIFTSLAEAEGKVHGLSPDEVHFHEVGATDSIVDIVGISLALDYLDVKKIFASKINTGSGFVLCAHGKMPVPAPATAELLAGFPFYHVGDEKELTTPTGAAVIKSLAEYSENLPRDFNPEKITYGAGYWDLSIPNVLRLYIGEYHGETESGLSILETNIDDMNPQDFGCLYGKLLSAGARDVWTTPIFMKKNRPAVTLSVLITSDKKEEFAEIIFANTTSIGLRVVPVAERIEAARRAAVVHTQYGEVSCKISAYMGHIVSISAEYDDLQRLSDENGVPVKKIRLAALMELSRRLGE